MSCIRWFAAVAMIGFSVLVPILVAQAQETLVAKSSQELEFAVFDWANERCELWDVPDAPLRAFRTDNGKVAAFASANTNRRFIGGSLESMHHTCHSSLTSYENPEPSSYSGLRFLVSTWTDDGRHVTGLVHNEYHAEHFGHCAFKASMPCWYTTIIAASSTDAGLSFQLASPPVVVAGVAFRQDVEQGRHRGFFNPSNIIKSGSYFYMLTNTTGGEGQAAGLCLFRTADVFDPTSWRGYDGQGFGAVAIDAYRQSPALYRPCRPVEHLATIGSISLYRPTGRFLAVFQGPDAAHPNGQIAYSWSDDLIHWEKPKNLLDVSDMSSRNCDDRVRYGYPSVLDSDSPGRNFDTIGDEPFLFLTRFHVSDCKLPPDRDLVRIRLKISGSVQQNR